MRHNEKGSLESVYLTNKFQPQQTNRQIIIWVWRKTANNDFVSFCPSISPICGKIIKSLLFFIFGKKKSAVFKKISSISNIFIKFASFPCHFQNDNVDNVNSFCKIEFIQIKFALKLLLFTWKRTINIILMLIYATRGWNLVLRLSLITRYLWCICVNRITLLNRKHCAVETTQIIYKPIMLK